MNALKNELSDVTSKELPQKIEELDNLVSKYKEHNDEISKNYKKAPDGNSLAKRFNNVKSQLNKIKNPQNLETELGNDKMAHKLKTTF
jgi:hypothetical protein